jgi:hypothetical protein
VSSAILANPVSVTRQGVSSYDLTAPLTSSVLQVKLASGTAFNVNFNNVTFAKLQADVSAATVTPTVWQIAAA